MEENRIAVINVSTEVKIINILYGPGTTAEDLCIKVCYFYHWFLFYFLLCPIFKTNDKLYAE